MICIIWSGSDGEFGSKEDTLTEKGNVVHWYDVILLLDSLCFYPKRENVFFFDDFAVLIARTR